VTNPIPLFESNTGVANAAGRAVARVQPLRAFERWEITRLAVSSTSTVLVPTARIYRGSETPSRLVDGTHTGTLDQSDTQLSLPNGEALLCVWEGADVGSQCTFTVEGTKSK